MKRGFIIILVVAILVVLIAAIYFTYFYYTKCDSYSCFSSRLAKCSRAQYQSDSSDATWFYRIEGKDSTNCKIYTELRQVKQGSLDLSSSLEQKSMYCYLPYGVVQSPESNLGNCHGELREAMQEIIIQRLHDYILGNLGNISETIEVNKVV